MQACEQSQSHGYLTEVPSQAQVEVTQRHVRAMRPGARMTLVEASGGQDTSAPYLHSTWTRQRVLPRRVGTATTRGECALDMLVEEFFVWERRSYLLASA